MAWEQLDITKPHLVYIILGGFTSLFMLCSSFIKERLYIGEATVATLCGVIFGPHAANLINPDSWGSVDVVTVEFSRIVLVVQCFAVGVELPKFYMEKHWRSVLFLLVPVMTAGWLLVSLFIWWMIPVLSWAESLVVAACVTATDPVLASSVVGKGKFAKRVPKHLRDLLSAESGCNDGMAFPFIYLSLYLIQYSNKAGPISFHFIVYVILYECIFGAVYGFLIGYIARHGIKYAERNDLIDRESFLVFYFVVALFCAGSGSILGVDDLLVGFAAGVGFSNDGWFGEKTEESHVSNVIDLLLNLAYFVYFGTIIPWEQYNNGMFGVYAWRLVVIAIFVILFRRIPIMLALKPFIPDIKSWREALFAGHFGPIGVGAIFVALLARAELEHHEPVPLSTVPPEGSQHYVLVYLVWPIVTFLVISSILVHGSSIAVFTLGKHINTLTLTMSYTAAPEDGPSWMNRLPRISSQSRSQARTMSETSFDFYKDPDMPAGTLAPPLHFLRRQKDEDAYSHSRNGSRASSLVTKKRRSKKWDDGESPGGPITQSAIFPSRSPGLYPSSPAFERDAFLPSPVPGRKAKSPSPETSQEERTRIDESIAPHEIRDPLPQPAPQVDVYDEGGQLIFENEDGDVLGISAGGKERLEESLEPPVIEGQRQRSKSVSDQLGLSLGDLKRRVTDMYSSEVEKRKIKDKATRRHEPARAYQFGNTIIVEDKDGEVVKTYELPSSKPGSQEGGNALLNSSLKYLGLGSLARQPEKSAEATAEEGQVGESSAAGAKAVTRPSWTTSFRGKKVAAEEEELDDKKIRFTIGSVGRRMNKEDFIREVQKLDASTRQEVVDQSSASAALKKYARQDPPMKEATKSQPAERVPLSPGSSSGDERRRESDSVSPPLRRPVESPPRGRGRRADSSASKPSEMEEETAVERKRRLAALASQEEEAAESSGEMPIGETPAERRRREAALGVSGTAAAESDSEDEDTERVPPTRRNIRFADSAFRPK
ncbi:Na(+)/H(+) antiporter [Escovopsis weberi]|uniref:Na(+)/H(+) antiporter n=1 Tax=Escovopsis weberi TaxID=150374 RepID=A0A0M8MWV7_ESCWE|nr:Na(+)/H(+) antiporter [Escovopsis weberi]